MMRMTPVASSAAPIISVNTAAASKRLRQRESPGRRCKADPTTIQIAFQPHAFALKPRPISMPPAMIMKTPMMKTEATVDRTTIDSAANPSRAVSTPKATNQPQRA